MNTNRQYKKTSVHTIQSNQKGGKWALIDNRPESVVQKKMYENISNSSAMQMSKVAQCVINPARKIDAYTERYKERKKKEFNAITALFTELKKSGIKYEEDEIHDAIRICGSDIKELELLAKKMEKAKGSELDESLGGEGAHGVSRHYVISDEDLEARLYGPHSVDIASRFTTDEGTRVLKLHNLIKNALIGDLTTQAKQIGERIHGIINEPSGEYTRLSDNNARKNYLQAEANAFNETFTHARTDDLSFNIFVNWKVKVKNNPPEITLTGSYKVESAETFEKDAWSLGPRGELVKEVVEEVAEMYSGSNSIVITMTATTPLRAVLEQASSATRLSGVTLF